MTVTLTYDDVFSRVRISVTGLDAATDEVKIERSTNQVSWQTVRGGAALIPTMNSVQLDDYEFAANVVNYYRATAVDTAATTFVAASAGATGNNTSLVAAMPAGLQDQDLVLIQASIRNSGAGEPVAPSGWVTCLNASNMKIFGKIVTGAEVAPTVTFTGGVANADTLVQTVAFRHASLTTGSTATRLNSAQANIPRPTLVVPDDNMLLIYSLWMQDDWVSVTTGPAGFAAIGSVGSAAGDDANQAWSYLIQTTKSDLGPSTATVTGGGVTISRSGAMSFYHANLTLSTETASITPTLTDVWLKSITRPFLNRTLNCIPNQTPITRRARAGIFPIVGRTFPIAVSDVRLARELSIEVITQTTQEWEEFNLITSTGDVFFIHTAPGNSLPTMYVSVGDITLRRPLRNQKCGNDWRVFTLPLTEVAMPSLELTGSLGTWQTVVNTYATWADVIAAHPTWADLLTLVGSPGEVVVP